MSRVALDLTVLAENGLRRGCTTGSCATAALKAALLLLLRREKVAAVSVSLPDSRYFLRVPIRKVQLLADGSVRAEVMKDAGDDPDCTDRAVIFVLVRINNLGELRFFAGPGVGTVTEPGIRVPIGEPAINPSPRQMMRWATDEVLNGAANPGFDLEIGCENGAEIAKKTFNPRLGILGGISILGTTGIVEPMSLAAYMASIEVYIRVVGQKAWRTRLERSGHPLRDSHCGCRRSVWCRSRISWGLPLIAPIWCWPRRGATCPFCGWWDTRENWRRRWMMSGIPIPRRVRWP